MRILLLIVFIFLSFLSATELVAQEEEDSVTTTILKKKKLAKLKRTYSLEENKPFIPNPKKAAMLSAVIPGLGQAYNKKYWKIPVIATGFAITGYFAAWNNKRLIKVNRVLDNWATNSDGSPNESISDTSVTSVPGYNINSYEEAQGIRDFHRRNKDYSIILMVILYGANVVDAAVDAHLYKFKITKDAIMSLEPTLTPNRDQSVSAGFKMSLTF